MKTKIVAISVLGTEKDAHGGPGPSRWDTWRPNIGLVQQGTLPITELHLIFSKEHMKLAERIRLDIQSVSPKTKVILDNINLRNPWDFEEVYGKFYDYAKQPCFHEEKTQYYIHMSTGSHVEQICLFLLAESRHLPAKLVQTTPKEGHVRHSTDTKGTITVIDLDLSRYDKLAKRFEVERQDDLSFLKQGIDTRNAAFNKLIETIERVAVRTADRFLLTGPTGAGKTQLAKRIYELRRQSGQVKGKFIGVNCATLGGDLASAALFGYRKGAFTGAAADHDGFLKEADGGILFLDEIGELPLDAQAKLLKAIEEKSYRPLGSDSDERSDFQLICGTNRDLDRDVADRKFRRDLLSRINLWNFQLPGLADRREDIEPNLEYELLDFSKRNGKHISFNKEARERFLAFALDPATRWEGNFRDLNAMVTRMATLAEGGRITLDVVEDEIARSSRRLAKAEGATCDTSLATLLGENVNEKYDRFDLAQLAEVIRVCRESDSMSDAAKKLFAVSRKAKSSSNDSDRLSKYLAKFGLKFKEIKAAK